MVERGAVFAYTLKSDIIRLKLGDPSMPFDSNRAGTSVCGELVVNSTSLKFLNYPGTDGTNIAR